MRAERLELQRKRDDFVEGRDDRLLIVSMKGFAPNSDIVAPFMGVAREFYMHFLAWLGSKDAHYHQEDDIVK